ncbi:MAG: hypothetical protein LAO31_12865 [Acidobacteriia bacterium]|nr:hypothetical protein [Terriglobia bacterium]
MKRVMLLSMVLLITSTLAAESNNVGTFRFVEKVGGHTVRLLFTTAPFERSKHRITFRKRLDSRVLEVDGREALGVDEDIPKVEIRSIKFQFDGRVVEVPRSLYADCFEPNFKKEYFAIKAGDDRKSLFVFMDASDGAGGYLVVWVLRSDGLHSRFSCPFSDCDYTRFMSYFVDQFSR